MYNKDKADVPIVRIDLVSLARNDVPKMSRAWCIALAECASVCLHLNDHRTETSLTLQGDFNKILPICPIALEDSAIRTHNDLQVTAELGAYGVAFLIVEHLTSFTVIERSRKKTGFDYWLGQKEDALMQRKARLEVSGIHDQPTKEFTRRIKLKLHQTKVSDTMGLPAYIIVVEFKSPKAHFELRKDTIQ